MDFLISLAISKVEKYCGIVLYENQKEAVLELINGKILEVPTGEGKTYIILTYAFIMSTVFKSKVVVLTPNKDLADRELTLYAKLEGIVVSADNYDSDVMVTYPSKIAFDYLYGKYNPLNYLIIVDELDFAIAECSNSSFGVSFSDTVDFSLIRRITQLILFLRNVTVAINDSITETEIKEIYDSSCNQDVVVYRAMDVLTIRESLYEKFRQFFGSLPDKTTLNLLPALLRAIYILRIDVDYKIMNGKVCLIDSSGFVSTEARFDSSIQVSLELINGCKPTFGNGSTYNLNYLVLLRRFKSVVGMSGTMIELKDDVLYLFNKNVKVIRSRYSSRLISTNTVITKTIDAKYRAVNELIKNSKGTVLCLCNTDEELNNMKANVILDKYYSSTSEDVSSTINNYKCVGATVVAGRGIDITSREITVIVCEILPNKRLLRQFYGRASRNGNVGTVHTVISEEDDISKKISGRITYRKINSYLCKQESLRVQQRRNVLYHGELVEQLRLHYLSIIKPEHKSMVQNQICHLSEEIKDIMLMMGLSYAEIGTKKHTDTLKHIEKTIKSFDEWIEEFK